MSAVPGMNLDSTTVDHTFTFNYGCVSTNLKFEWTIEVSRRTIHKLPLIDEHVQIEINLSVKYNHDIYTRYIMCISISLV